MWLAVNRVLELSRWEMLIDLKQVMHDEQRTKLSSATMVAKLIVDWLEEQKYYHAEIDESPRHACCNEQDNSLHPCYKTSIHNYLRNSPAGLYRWYMAWPYLVWVQLAPRRRSCTRIRMYPFSFEFSFSKLVYMSSNAREDLTLCHCKPLGFCPFLKNSSKERQNGVLQQGSS